MGFAALYPSYGADPLRAAAQVGGTAALKFPESALVVVVVVIVVVIGIVVAVPDSITTTTTSTSLGRTRTPIMRGPKRTSGGGQISVGGGSPKMRA
jgi:hypothetical protein